MLNLASLSFILFSVNAMSSLTSLAVTEILLFSYSFITGEGFIERLLNISPIGKGFVLKVNSLLFRFFFVFSDYIIFASFIDA
jgi:hypothetical protein